MRSAKSLSLVCTIIFVITFTPNTVHNEISGEAGRPNRYEGSMQLGIDPSDLCEFMVEIERVTFLLNAFGDKYKVIRIRIENRSMNSAQLSPENDSIELITKGNDKVQGLVKLQNQDASLWDSLNLEMREILAYPQTIQARAGGRPKMMYLFVFFPKDRVTELPVGFRYRIASLPRPIEITPPRIARK